jgi:hypothetical protein
MKKSSECRIRGTVIPGDWDANSRVVGVAIKTGGGEEYLVDKNKLGKELLVLIQKTVEVTGTVREHEDGYMVVNVKRFEVLGERQGDAEAYA